MAINSNLCVSVSPIIGQLRGTSFEELANASLDLAAKAQTTREAVERFRELETKIKNFEGELHRIRGQLHMRLDEEERLIDQPVPGRRLRKRRHVRPLASNSLPPQQSVEVASNPVCVANAQPPLPVHISDLPSLSIQGIFGSLEEGDKARFFHAVASQQTEGVREAAITEVVLNLPPVSTDPEVCKLYELVYGESLPSQGMLKERDTAKRLGNSSAVQEIDAKIGKSCRTLSCLKARWRALPEKVRALFENLDDSQILSNPDVCKSVLQAIRAYNLLVVRDRALYHAVLNFHFLKKQELIEAGEAAAQHLAKGGATLTHLDLSYSKLTCLPIEVTRLPNLISLSLAWNLLTELPPQIGDLSHLTSLDLAVNRIAALPSEIGKLSNLVRFRARYNRITSLPTTFGNLGKLADLDLAANRLTVLPSTFSTLTSLRTVNLCSNKLTSVPIEVGSFCNLSSLNVSHNPLKVTP